MSVTRAARDDAAVGVSLPWVCALLALLHLAAAGAAAVATQAGTATGIPRVVPVAAHLAVAVSAGAIAGLLLWRRPDDPMARPLAAGAFGLSLAATLVHLLDTEQPAVASLLAVTVALAPMAFPMPAWTGAVVGGAWAAWTAGAVMAVAPRAWTVSLVTMAGATGVAGLALLARRVLVSELAQARDVAAAAAVRDNLTGLANRRGLAMLGAQIVETARRQGDAVHCVFLDLDGFRVVNDALGRDVGDEVLVAVAEVLRSATRSTDVVARWGGDEFCIVGPGPGTAPLELERRVRERLLSEPPVPTETWDPRVSAGGAMLAPWDSGSLDTLLGKADQEMYLRRAVRREGAPLPPRRVAGQ